MQKILRLTVILLLYSLTVQAAGVKDSHAPVSFRKTFSPSASFDSIWVDYNIKENDKLGMRIHLKFSTYGMKDMDAYVAIYYEFNDDIAGYLKDKNKAFQSSEGDVALYKSIRPAYDPADYKDLQLFMPYSELDLEPGIYDLTMDVKLIYKEGGMIDRLTYYNFEYTRPGSPADVESSVKADATLHDMWIDYNVKEGGKTGMMIHVNFTAYNLKDVDCYVAVYFEKKNRDRIDGTNPEYSSKSGQLAVYKSFKPAYAEAVYKDLKLFMPYSEIKLGSGRFDLRLDASLILKNGDKIKNLKEQEFWFEQ